jgi:hypothetical protein
MSDTRNIIVTEANGYSQEIMSCAVRGAFFSQGWLVIKLSLADVKVAISCERRAVLWLRSSGWAV